MCQKDKRMLKTEELDQMESNPNQTTEKKEKKPNKKNKTRSRATHMTHLHFSLILSLSSPSSSSRSSFSQRIRNPSPFAFTPPPSINGSRMPCPVMPPQFSSHKTAVSLSLPLISTARRYSSHLNRSHSTGQSTVKRRGARYKIERGLAA